MTHVERMEKVAKIEKCFAEIKKEAGEIGRAAEKTFPVSLFIKMIETAETALIGVEFVEVS